MKELSHGIAVLLVAALPLAACGGGSGQGGGAGSGATGHAGSGGPGTAGAAASGTAGSGPGTAGHVGSSTAGTGGPGTAGSPGSGTAGAGTGPKVGTGNPTPTYTCARELHVATTGSDTAGDGSMAKPWKTIAKVTPMAMPGDCVQVHAGTYPETATIGFSNDGTMAAPIVLRSADGPLKAVIDGTNDRPGPTVLVRQDYVIIDGFEFKGSPMDTEEQCIHFDGLNKGKGQGTVLRNSKLTAGYDTVKCNENSSGITIEFNEIYGTFQHLPVSLTGASNFTFRGNFCHDWTLDGDGAVQIKGGSHDALFEGNVFQDVHTDAGAIAMGDGCDSTCDIDPAHYAAVRIRAVNNVFVRVGRGLDVQGCKDCAILNNTFVDSGKGNVMLKLTSATTNGTTTATVNARILNNLLSNTGDGGNVMQINDPAGMGLMMDYNLRWNAGMAVEWGDGHPGTADTHSVTMDPKLTSATDFSLAAGSAAIGAGTNLFADVPVDFKGAARPTTGPFDIGAYQSQ